MPCGSITGGGGSLVGGGIIAFRMFNSTFNGNTTFIENSVGHTILVGLINGGSVSYTVLLPEINCISRHDTNFLGRQNNSVLFYMCQ